jgi:phospholipase D1/2
VIALAVAALAAAWRFTPLAEIATPDNITAWTRSVRSTWWAPILMVAAYTPGAIVLFPRPLLTLVSVITFGAVLGVAYATAGVLLAALVTYLLGRMLKRDTVRRIAGDALESAGNTLREHGVIAVFGFNMLPTPPFGVQNMIAGAARIPLWQFMLGTFFSLVPAIVAWTLFGDQIGNALDKDAKVSFWLIGAALVFLVGFIFVSRSYLKKKGLYGKA